MPLYNNINKLLFKPTVLIIFFSFLMPGLFSKKQKKPKQEKAAPSIIEASKIDSLSMQSDSTQTIKNIDQVERSTQSFGVEELNVEMQKMRAELDYYIQTLREIQTKGKMFGNPLEIYDKEIILNNGSTIFGKILYQDRESIKVETLIGNLIVNRKEVVRVIDNKGVLLTSPDSDSIGEMTDEAWGSNQNTEIESYIPKEGTKAYEGQESKNVIERTQESLDASLILIGDIKESKDMSGNIVLLGEIKNVGTQRADFVKIVFSFRTDWAGESKTKVAFAKGTKITLEDGETIDSSIMPGAVGSFKLIIPKDFGTFIGYSYVLDWAQIN